jgi:hypothetical protein
LLSSPSVLEFQLPQLQNRGEGQDKEISLGRGILRSGHIPGRGISLAHDRLDSLNCLFDSTKLYCQAVIYQYHHLIPAFSEV